MSWSKPTSFYFNILSHANDLVQCDPIVTTENDQANEHHHQLVVYSVIFRRQPPAHIRPYIYYWCSCKTVQLTNTRKKIELHISRKNKRSTLSSLPQTQNPHPHPANVVTQQQQQQPIPPPHHPVQQDEQKCDLESSTSTHDAVEKLEQATSANQQLQQQLEQLKDDDEQMMLQYETRRLEEEIRLQHNHAQQWNLMTTKVEKVRDIMKELSDKCHTIDNLTSSNKHHDASVEIAALSALFMSYFNDSTTFMMTNDNDYISLDLCRQLHDLVRTIVYKVDIANLIKIRSTIVRLSSLFHTDAWLLLVLADNRILESIQELPIPGYDMLHTFTLLIDIVSSSLKHYNPLSHMILKLYPYHLNFSQSLAFWFQFITQIVKPRLQLAHLYLPEYPVDHQTRLISVNLESSKNEINQSFRKCMLANHSDRTGGGTLLPSSLPVSIIAALKERLFRFGDANDMLRNINNHFTQHHNDFVLPLHLHIKPDQTIVDFTRHVREYHQTSVNLWKKSLDFTLSSSDEQTSTHSTPRMLDHTLDNSASTHNHSRHSGSPPHHHYHRDYRDHRRDHHPYKSRSSATNDRHPSRRSHPHSRSRNSAPNDSYRHR